MVENIRKIFSESEKENDRKKDKENIGTNETLFDERKLKQIMVEAAKKTNLLGSSTLSTLLIDNKNNCLYSCYIGDSVFMILRFKKNRYHKLFKSRELSHTFNHPYQLGIKGDNPEVSIINKHDLDENDIIILASDGLWDNVHDMEIEVILNNQLERFKNGKENNSLEELTLSKCNQYFLNEFTDKLSIRAMENALNK